MPRENPYVAPTIERPMRLGPRAEEMLTLVKRLRFAFAIAAAVFVVAGSAASAVAITGYRWPGLTMTVVGRLLLAIVALAAIVGSASNLACTRVERYPAAFFVAYYTNGFASIVAFFAMTIILRTPPPLEGYAMLIVSCAGLTVAAPLLVCNVVIAAACKSLHERRGVFSGDVRQWRHWMADLQSIAPSEVWGSPFPIPIRSGESLGGEPPALTDRHRTMLAAIGAVVDEKASLGNLVMAKIDGEPRLVSIEDLRPCEELWGVHWSRLPWGPPPTLAELVRDRGAKS